MSVAEVAEVVDVFGGKKRASGEGVDGCVAPLEGINQLMHTTGHHGI